jgi:IclR family transcriptional regulator, KDG regulon repressor
LNETRSLKRALSILDLFSVENSELGVTEASAQLDLSKGTVSRLMHTLKMSGILAKNARTKKYRLGSKVLRFSRVYLSNTDLKTIAAPYLKELSQKTNELILLHVIREDRRFCLDWIESTQPIRHVIEKDHVYTPLHAGSAGKLLLAFLPDEKINEIIGRTGLPRFTEKTITDPLKLKQEINKIRQTGFSMSHGEHMTHASTVSAPVRNWSGQVVAALSISWLQIGETQKKEACYPGLAKEAALRLSQDLGYQENAAGRNV